MTTNLLTFDFGKTSIRTIVGVYEDKHLTMHEINRIPTIPLELDNHTYLDIGWFMQTIIKGLIDAAEQFGSIASLGIGFWGGVFALLNEKGKTFRYPFHYSDKTFRNNRNILEGLIPQERIFTEYEGGATTSSISMLLAIRECFPDELNQTKTLLMMPDYLAYLLTGNKDCEETILSSGGLSNVYKQWNMKAFKDLNLPLHIFEDRIVAPGNKYPLLPVYNSIHPNLSNTEYVRVASHDTASAVSTINLNRNSAFISSGSTSIMGIVTDTPVVSMEAYKERLLNEITGDGRIRLLRNIHGMTIQNNCMSYWNDKNMNITFDEIDKDIVKIPALKFMINPNDSSFLHNNGNMPAAIAEYCRNTNQPIPITPAETLAAINTGLAMEYKNTIESLVRVTGEQINTIHIVGGGLANEPLCQFTANATGCMVVTGNKEATSIGNLLMQAKALGLFSNYEDIAKIDKTSFPDRNVYKPEYSDLWEKAYNKYLSLID